MNAHQPQQIATNAAWGHDLLHLEASIVIGVPLDRWMVYFMENPNLDMDDWGVPWFLETFNSSRLYEKQRFIGGCNGNNQSNESDWIVVQRINQGVTMNRNTMGDGLEKYWSVDMCISPERMWIYQSNPTNIGIYWNQSWFDYPHHWALT